MCFGQGNDATFPEFIQPWPNNNMNIPTSCMNIPNFIPIHPNLLRYQHPTQQLQTPLLPHFDSLQITPPISLSGVPISGYPDPRRPLIMPPGLIPPLAPATQRLLFPNIPSNGMPQNQISNHYQEINCVLPGNSTNPNKSFQDTSHQSMYMSENSSHGPVPPILSEQQAKANANLELASRLSATKNTFSTDIPFRN